MSHSAHSYHQTADHAPRPRPSHRKSAAAVSRHLYRVPAAYTLAHGGRQVRFGPVAFWVVVGALVVMAVWSVATGGYFAFHQDVLSHLISRQTAMEIAYEDRIAELRAQIERITSRQLLDQDEFEKKLTTLLKRQATLEQRTAELGSDALSTGSLDRKHRNSKQMRTSKAMKLSSISDTLLFSRESLAAKSQIATGGVGGILEHVSQSLGQVAHWQTARLKQLQRHYDGKARRMRGVLKTLGVSGKAPADAEGGPFIPVKLPGPHASAFARQLYHVNLARAEIAHYSHRLSVVPVRKPLAGRLDVTSPFGVRIDPFLGTPAMHPGVDLGGEIGEPVHATANGKVMFASWDGGYGNLVEINHGHGLSTRYGHLSEIDVKVGQKVRRGEVVGRIGSTGRSTGPHLHYETRINGKPVDPEKFLRAGVKLGLL